MLAALVLLLLLFGRSLGALHNAAMLVLGVAAMPLLAVFESRLRPRVQAWAEKIRGASAGIDSGRPPYVRAFAVGLFVLAWVKFWVLGSVASGFTPALHDEWSYLFGAETFARGRLWNEPPPHPEFFDAFHILCSDRWLTRYPPGHPAVLAIGVWVGWPALVPISLGAAVVLATFALARETTGHAAGIYAGLLALWAPGIDLIATTYLSQATFVPAMTCCLLATMRAERRSDWRWAWAAGVAGGLAILARPYSAVAMGLPPAWWFAWRGLVGGRAANGYPGRVRLVAAAALPLVVTAALWAAYNRATTGQAFRTAWQEYNRRYEPANTLGFAGATAATSSGGLNDPENSDTPARKAAKARGIAQEKAAFTAGEALRRAVARPTKLLQWLLPAVGFAGLLMFLPRAIRGAVAGLRPAGWRVAELPPQGQGNAVPSRQNSRFGGTPAGLLLVTGASHYVAYSFFYSTWGAYGLEVLPIVIALTAAGLVGYVRDAAATDRPSIAWAAPLFLVAAVGFATLVHLPRFVVQRRNDTAYHRRLATLMDRVPHTPAVLFIRLDPDRPHPWDAMHNSPDLDGRVVLAWDFGAKANQRLCRQSFSTRHAYVWDESTSEMLPLGNVGHRVDSDR
jgi:4-amino-4-deoxy-L-arabinose transferase-like glycosyltransferase